MGKYCLNYSKNELIGIMEDQMQCPRGGVTTYTEHQVKTLAKAKEWWVGTAKEDLPITVHKTVTSNGRMSLFVTRWDNKIIHRRG